MIATNVACRGLDVKEIEYVINYDMPKKDYGGISEYVHRIGRTGRIGHKGKAISFYSEKDVEIAQDLVNVLAECGQEIPDFLAEYTPEEPDKINFDDDSEDEGADVGEEGETAEGEAEGGAPVADAW